MGKIHHVPGHLHLYRKVLLLGQGQIGEVACILGGGGHPGREMIVSSHDNTNSETDVPVGEGLGYPPGFH